VVEAAVRAHRRDVAVAHADAMVRAGLPRLSSRLELVTAGATAMAAPDADAGPLFERALAVPGASRWPFEQARIQLHHGERLRRLRQPAHARGVLREALDTFDRLGAAPWAARAAAALRASGQAPPRVVDPDVSGLSPRDWQIVRMAASGLTNKQIGERLYVSPRTVGATLHRLFPTFGVTSRAGLTDALAALEPRDG
jgi:DNA-binding CsgD family transcriptional regulator